MYNKLNASQCAAFYRCRMQEDLKQKLILPNKGSVAKVHAGEVDKKPRVLY